VTALFALTPIVIKNAAVTQDFLPGLALVLAACIAATRRRPVVAGVMLGLAVGMRLTNVLFLVPLALLLFFGSGEDIAERRGRAVAAFVGVAITLAFLLYLPFVLVWGAARTFLPASDKFGTASWHLLPVAVYNLIYVLGPVATLGVLVILFIERRSVGRRVSEDLRSRNAIALVSALAVLMYFALCLRFTMKPEYFLPAIPFAYLLLGRWLSRRSLQVMVVLVAAFGVFSIEVKGGVSGRREFSPHPAWGLLVEDFVERREFQELRSGIGELRGLGKAVVLTGVEDQLTWRNPALETARAAEICACLEAADHQPLSPVFRVVNSDVFMTFSLSSSNVERLRRANYRIYMFSEYAPRWTMDMFGYNPYDQHIDVLPILSPDAFYKRRSGVTARNGL